jgi:bifunctional DNA-binding transcriptional regulator/antitoxin component of YhaV-PrlF toxin-antitoxin module
MNTITVSSKYQIVIPSKIREALGTAALGRTSPVLIG